MPGNANAWNAFAIEAKISELDKRIAARHREQGIQKETLRKKKKRGSEGVNLQSRIQQLRGVNKTRRDIMNALDE